MDFKIRIYNCDYTTSLQDIPNIAISNITLVSKRGKFNGICLHKSNQKKFGYSIQLTKKFHKVAGSNSYPILAFKGEYIDIIVKNFPRYPAFYQDTYDAKSILKGSNNAYNQGFPSYLKHRKIEIIDL